MYFINKEYNNLYEIKRSKFYAHLIPYDQFNKCLERLKNNHPKARHFVYAYRYLNEFNQIVENSSDDGEPKGTSGKPSLTVLNGANIINSAVIIVRYFGGIKLGTGGLVRAYGTSIKEVLNIAKLQEYIEQIDKKIILDYSQLSQVEYLIKNYSITIVSKNFNNNVEFILKSSKTIFEEFEKKLFRDIQIMDLELE